MPKSKASSVQYQGSPSLPVTYYKWTRDENVNRLVNPIDPYQTEMFITYGPLVLYDVEGVKKAMSNGEQVGDDYFYDAYWVSLNIKGTTIALREDEHVIMYMAIQNPEEPDFYELWSCHG